MIVATAGHIDHGKTSLVKALTGVDTDRTEQEKRRGMSIDLGFAYAPFGQNVPLGFVDVPGHERFLRNMLAGVAAIDMALLVIAADDGPMPQTVEHLAVLDLLGVDHCAVALTKIDRVGEPRLAQVRTQIQSMLADSDRLDVPIFPVSMTQHTGLTALIAYLTQAHAAHVKRATTGTFRLAVDRAFVAPGAGLVVTGAVLAGRCNEGDALRNALCGTQVRVRSIRSHGQPVAAATAGERCALNLSGLELKRHPIKRGDWITALDAGEPTSRFDARVRLHSACPKTLSDGTQLHLHIGAAERHARVALLGERTLAAGASAWAQLTLDEPVHAVNGDRFVIRDSAARRVIGGGVVIEPVGAPRGRAKPERIARLAALSAPAPDKALAALLQHQTDGVDLAAFAISRGLSTDAAKALSTDLALHRFSSAGPDFVITSHSWNAARIRLLDALRDFHASNPQSIGPSESQWSSAAGWRSGTPLVRAMLRALLDEQTISRKGFRWQLATHRPILSQADTTLLQRISAELERGGLRPPIVGDIATELAMPLPDLIAFLQRASSLGLLIQVAKNRWFLPSRIESLTETARSLCASSIDGKFDAAAFRDASGLGRNLTIELLEFFDRSQLTRFDGTRRCMASTSPQDSG